MFSEVIWLAFGHRRLQTPNRVFFFFFSHLFLLVGGELLHNILVGFVIHWHESAMDLHVFPIPIPPPTSLSTQFLWVFPVHRPEHLSHASSLGWWSNRVFFSHHHDIILLILQTVGLPPCWAWFMTKRDNHVTSLITPYFFSFVAPKHQNVNSYWIISSPNKLLH